MDSHGLPVNGRRETNGRFHDGEGLDDLFHIRVVGDERRDGVVVHELLGVHHSLSVIFHCGHHRLQIRVALLDFRRIQLAHTIVRFFLAYLTSGDVKSAFDVDFNGIDAYIIYKKWYQLTQTIT